MGFIFTYIKAYLVGGLFCVIGQLLIDRSKLTPARILTSFVVAGVILSALGIYGPLADWAGAGATVPLVGFGHLLAEGVRKALTEDGLLAVIGGGIGAASAGLGAAVCFGLLAAIIAKPHDKG